MVRGARPRADRSIPTWRLTRRFYVRPAAEAEIAGAVAWYRNRHPGTRVPVDGVPTPRQFLEFVFACFYPDDYRKHRLPHPLVVPAADSIESATVLLYLSLQRRRSLL
jgi:hypothetical protein